MDLAREVLLEFKADTSDAKKEIRELDGEEKAYAEHQLERMNVHNENLETFVDKLAKVKLAMTAVHEVGEIIWDGYKEGIKEARLETAAAGIDIEKLSEAAGGLKTNMELLEFAAKANKSAFHNTQEDMEMAERAMRALEQRGLDAAEAQDAVTHALVEGKTKGLEPYGIVVDKHIDDLKRQGEENLTLAQKQEIHKNAMESLKIVADEVSDSQENLGDSMKHAQVRLSDAWAEIKKGLGELVVAFAPVIESLATVLGLVAKIGHAVGEAVGDTKDFVRGMAHDMDAKAHPERYTDMSGADVANMVMGSQEDWTKLQATMDRYGQGARNLGLKFQQYYIDPNNIEIDNPEWKRDVEAEKKAAIAAAERQAKDVLRTARGTGYDASGTLGFNTDTMDLGMAAHERDLSLAGPNTLVDAGLQYQRNMEAFQQASGYGEDSLNKGQKEMLQATTSMKDVLQYAQEFKNQKNETLMEKAFGKVDDVHIWRDAFEGLKSTVVSGYEAMAKGHESLGSAMKKTAANTVLAEGSKMQVLALENVAYAAFSAATGDWPGAAKHAEAAVLFEAGAVAAAVVANELGVGGSSGKAGSGGSSGGSGGSSGGSSSGGSGGGSRGSSNSGGKQTLIVYADSFAEDSARNRAQRAERILNTVIGTGPVRYS